MCVVSWLREGTLTCRRRRFRPRPIRAQISKGPKGVKVKLGLTPPAAVGDDTGSCVRKGGDRFRRSERRGEVTTHAGVCCTGGKPMRKETTRRDFLKTAGAAAAAVSASGILAPA